MKADRSLGGRMVCGRCGTPLQGVQRSRPAALSGRRRWPWWLLALVLSAGALAAVDPGSRQPFAPHGSSDRPLDRWQ
ncbi:MAG: hypothetical protein ACO27M_08190 [Vulcanococcus sp.]